jgi:hypothetical protein
MKKSMSLIMVVNVKKLHGIVYHGYEWMNGVKSSDITTRAFDMIDAN